ncbi:MAG: T9SS type A sorting domain-containing protein [Bacteroidia bacterium]
MKKHLLIGVAVGIGSIVCAQNNTMHTGKKAPKIKPEVANKVLPYRKQALDSGAPGFQAAAQSNNQHNHQAVGVSRSFASAVIGTSMYDLQSNASICNRIVLNSDGTIGATWTMSHDSDPTTSPNRGTGYNYFDGTNWGTPPTARLESIRCGWPNLAVTGTGGEVIVSHEATSGVGNIHVLRRPVKGTGSWTDTTLGYPDVWPRMVVGGANGMSIHIISQTTGASGSGNPPFHGQDGAIAYSRSLDGGITWDKVQTVIPEIDSSHYLGFGGDSYAIDAKGDTIVIVAGGFDVDVVLLKSTDNGTSWTKTIVHEFPIPLYDASTMDTDLDDDGTTDTIETNDASVAVLLDNAGKAHVWFGRMRVIEDVGETNLSYFPGTDGLWYWNETMAEPGIVAFAEDIDGDNMLNVEGWGTYQTSLTSFPSAGIDTAGNIYLSYGSIYEGVAEEGVPGGGKSFRHTYVMMSRDGGFTWCGPINVVNPDYTDDQYDYLEGVFGAVARDVDGSVHLVYQKDNSPGHALSSNNVDPQSGNESEIIYVNLPVNNFDAFLSCDSLFFDLESVGIKEVKDVAKNVQLYPNPAASSVNLLLSLNKAEKVTVKITNMMGQELNAFEENMAAGDNKLNINISNYKPGVYFVKTTVHNKVVTKKLIVE